MMDLDDIWAKYVGQQPTGASRPDFRVDPTFCRNNRIPLDDPAEPKNLYQRLRRKHSGIDKVLFRLVTDLGLKAAMSAEVPGSFELAFELINLGAPVDERVSNFSMALYVHLHPDIRLRGMNPLQHFLLFGPREGRWSLEAQRNMEREGGRAFNPDLPTCMIVVHEMSATGAPIIGLELVREAARTHNVVVAALRDGPLLAEFAGWSVAVLITSDPLTSLRFANCLRNIEIDFALLNSAACAVFVPWFVGAGIPFLTYIHEYPDYLRPRAKVTNLALFSDLLVFLTETLRSAWGGVLADLGVPTEDTLILPQYTLRAGGATADGIRDARTELSNALGRDLTKARLVCGSGFLQWRKGVDLFATAAVAARSRDPECVFIWIGDGLDTDDLNFGVWARYHFALAGVDDPDGALVILPTGSLYRPLLRAADSMLMPSRIDPLPNVVFEAIEVGCPVVLFDKATGFDDQLYRDSGHFTYVPYGNAEAAAEALLALPRKVPQDQTPAEATGPLRFAALAQALSARLARRRHFVAGVGDSDVSLLFDGGPEYRSLRAREREKLFGVRRKVIWRNLQEVRDELAQSTDWVHETVRVESFAPTPAAALPAFSVHIHASAIEEVPKLLGGHALLRSATRIVVTVDSEAKSDRLKAAIEPADMPIEVVAVPNRGRDVLPFLSILREGGGDLWCHLHADKSLGPLPQAEGWRDLILGVLLGDENEVSNAPLLLAEGRTALVAPLDPYVGCWGASRSLLPKAEVRLGRRLPERPLLFPSGGMFWIRRPVMETLDRLFGRDYPWPNEPTPTDGTEYHLIGRLWPTLVAASGLESVFLHDRKVVGASST